MKFIEPTYAADSRVSIAYDAARDILNNLCTHVPEFDRAMEAKAPHELQELEDAIAAHVESTANAIVEFRKHNR